MNLSVILPLVRRSGFWFRLLAWSLLVVAVCFSMLLLVLRHWLLPDIEHYREDIAAVITQAAGQRVTIGAVSANWDGLRPHLMLRTVQVHDKEGNPALLLNRIESTLSWLSLLHGEVRFHAIRIAQPDLTIRRDTNGIIHVAGIALSPDQSESSFPDWLLRQRRLVISDASILWQDDQRGAPPLELKAVNLRLENRGQHHRFGIHAIPPSGLAAPLDVRGDFTGDSLNTLGKWRGQLFTQLDYADIAAWRTWLSFPETIEFNHGAGALRMWLGMDGTVVEGLTADIHLRNIRTRLAQELPELNLIRLQGRVGWKRINNGTNEGVELSTRGLSISIHGEEALQPLDLSLQTFPARDGKPGSGKLSVNVLDLGTLMSLTEYLPIHASLHERLDELSPTGEIREMRAEWNGEWPAPAHFGIKGKFANLGMKRFAPIPAFSGFSGDIDGSEKGGALNFNSQKINVALPAVFREPVMLDTFTGQVNWGLLTDKNPIEFNFNNIAFANDHAAGVIYGSYRSVPDGPGVIDLNGHLTRADARYVGHYVPMMVSQSIRDWLNESVVAGELTDVRLHLKGDLAEFPFNHNEHGIFQINAKASGVALDYLSEWPRIENISADLLFHGSRMEIITSHANIFGAGLHKVKVQLADMTEPDTTLKIEGTATGAARDFIRFIEKSPLGSHASGLIGDISATGDGELLLKLDIPLHHPDGIKLTGNYLFLDNQIDPGPYLPNLEKVNGALTFTESGIKIEEITARILGGSAVINSSTPSDGSIRITATGKADLDNLHQLTRSRPANAVQTSWGRRLRGSTDWQAVLQIRNKLANVSIESSLQGIASDLPEPFAKTASDSMPLRFERKAVDSRRDDLILRYGRLAAMQIKRSQDNAGNYHVERGMVSFGTTSALSPARVGVAVSGSLPLLDMDQWHGLFKQLNEGAGPSLGLTRVNLHIGALDFLDRRFNNVTLNARMDGGEWHSTVASKEIGGDINWHPAGNGKVIARLKNLVIPASSKTKPVVTAQTQEKSLPALDVIADNFVVDEKSLGRLELLANQQKQDWHIEKLHITNSDSSLVAKGIWHSHAIPPRIQADIKLEASDIGKLLVRLGYPERVKRGRGELEGVLSWSGSPRSINYPTLSGNLKLKAKQGQFPKLETGIGKLFSIFDLQALPRRITLDFRDVLSEGFGFDNISGNVKINRGVAVTDDLRIRGSAAKFALNGEVDLAAETQKLHVKVMPSLGLVTPVAGIASMIANKELRDPFDQVVSSEYNVTGTWADPVITEVAR